MEAEARLDRTLVFGQTAEVPLESIFGTLDTCISSACRFVNGSLRDCKPRAEVYRLFNYRLVFKAWRMQDGAYCEENLQ